MKLLLSPHNDDESLFAAYTIMRERPLVVVVADCNVQFTLGWGITAEQRKEESRQGCKVLGADVDFLGIPEDAILRETLVLALRPFVDFELVFAPAIQGGNAQHDLLGEVASELFPNVRYYSTYTSDNLTPVGESPITPTQEQIDLKNKALNCYETQIRVNSVHFNAVRGKPEYLNDTPHSWRQQ